MLQYKTLFLIPNDFTMETKLPQQKDRCTYTVQRQHNVLYTVCLYSGSVSIVTSWSGTLARQGVNDLSITQMLTWWLGFVY